MALEIDNKAIIVAPTDFCITVESITDRKGVALDTLTAPFYFEFFGSDVLIKIRSNRSYDINNEGYTVSYDGTDRVNNTIEDGVLKFQIGGYPMRDTYLYYKQISSYENEAFSDGSEDIYTIERLPIRISSDGSNSESDDFINAIVSVAALKGDKGDDYILTDTDKQDIANLVEVNGGASIEFDKTPTENSDNAVSSGGVYEALQNINAETINTTGDITSENRVIAEGYIRSKNGNVFTNDGNVYTSGGDIYTTKGEMYNVEGDIRAYNGSFYKGSGDDKVEVAYKNELESTSKNLDITQLLLTSTGTVTEEYYNSILSSLSGMDKISVGGCANTEDVSFAIPITIAKDAGDNIVISFYFGLSMANSLILITISSDYSWSMISSDLATKTHVEQQIATLLARIEALESENS